MRSHLCLRDPSHPPSAQAQAVAPEGMDEGRGSLDAMEQPAQAVALEALEVTMVNHVAASTEEALAALAALEDLMILFM